MATKLCTEYDDLTTQERVIMIGKIQHAMQVNSEAFKRVELLIKLAVSDGVFEGVKIDACPDQKREAISKAIRENDLNERTVITGF